MCPTALIMKLKYKRSQKGVLNIWMKTAEKDNNFLTALKGLIIGGTMLVPGVSGGSMAMILGIYDRLISSVSSFMKSKKENLVFLVVFSLGGILGVLLVRQPAPAAHRALSHAHALLLHRRCGRRDPADRPAGRRKTADLADRGICGAGPGRGLRAGPSPAGSLQCGELQRGCGLSPAPHRRFCHRGSPRSSRDQCVISSAAPGPV